MLCRRTSPRETRGMTLLELAVAMVILGMIVAVVHASLNNLSARWQLRAAADHVEAVVRFAQNAAATRAQPAQVLYDVPKGAFWVRIPGERQSFAYNKLPDAVSFQEVRFANGREVVRDVAAVTAFPDGTLDGHDVFLLSRDETRITVSFDRLTGNAAFTEEDHDAATR